MENPTTPNKPTIRIKPLGATAPTKLPPTPNSNQTIKLRPAGSSSPIGVPPPSQTIRLKTPGTVPPPAVAAPVNTMTGRVPMMPGVAGTHENTSTGKIPLSSVVPSTVTPGDVSTGRIAHVTPQPEQLMETATAVVAKMTPPKPQAAAESSGPKTINLQAVAGPSSSSPTINLETSGENVSHGGATIKLGNSNVKTVRKTLSIKKPTSASAPTMRLNANKPEGEEAEIDRDRDGELPAGEEVVPFARFDAKSLKVLDDGTTGALPHAIVASIAFLALGFMLYASIAQMVNVYGEDQMKFTERVQKDYMAVPGFIPFNDILKGKADR